MNNFIFLNLGTHPLANAYLSKNELKKKRENINFKLVLIKITCLFPIILFF